MTDIEKHNSKDDDSLEEKENLLDSFLSNLQAFESEAPANVEVSSKELAIINPSDYPEIEIDRATEEKIKELQTISRRIEDKDDQSAIPAVIPQGKNYEVDYKNCLNDDQLKAIITLKGPLLVIAGAGTGKTRVIVHRLSYMIENGIDPHKILLLTFTRKAANEMMNRAETLLNGKSLKGMIGGTFHSFASYVLRKHANMIGLHPKFTIIDQSDSEDTIDLIRTELKYNSAEKKFPKKGRIQEVISIARNCNTSIKDVIDKQFDGLIEFEKDIELIAKGYAQYKKICNILDFDDLIEFLRNALRDHSAFRKKMQDQFQYIMVDEFQDTNIPQKEIIDFIAEKHQNIMVVGDDAQSIYAFRGANLENILRFPEKYPDCRVIKIQHNYRSSQNILEFTNSILGNAVIGYKKKLFSDYDYNTLPIVKKFYSQEEEAEFIVNKIIDISEKNIAYKQIAILNRADWHNRFIQTELLKKNIPYVVIGGFKFNERKHVKDVISYLRIILNPTDAVAWHRVLKLVSGIGVTIASSIIKHLLTNKGKITFDTFEGKRFYNDLKKMQEMLLAISGAHVSLTEKIEIIRKYYAPILEAREHDYKSRLLDVDVLSELAKKYDDLEKYLSDFALDPPNKNAAGKSKPLIDENEDDSAITISTIHSAKGLEWNTVFVPHALDGMLPSNRVKNIEELEEERRLFYVACSRAKEQLFVTYPHQVSTYNAYFTWPSRFLAEIGTGKYLFDT